MAKQLGPVDRHGQGDARMHLTSMDGTVSELNGGDAESVWYPACECSHHRF